MTPSPSRRCPSLFGLVLACCALLLTGFEARERQVIQGPTMGTSYRIVVSAAADHPPLAPVRTAITASLERMENQMSTWRPESELSRFNASQSTDWFPVSDDVVAVASEARDVWQLSDGAFDPTVAPLIELWHFADEPGDRTIPSDKVIRSAQQHVGFELIEIRTSPPALRKTDPAAELNLSAIAKGYAVDVVSDLLVEEGFPHHLVEIGGEMRSRGHKQDGSLWMAGIEKPDALPRQLYTALPLDDQAIATSGDYRNFYEVDGQRYSHTIDPQTGRPVTHNLASVTVLADRCVSADALATAIEVLGPQRGLELAEKQGIATLLVSRTKDGFSHQTAGGFPAVERPANPNGRGSDNGPGPLLATILAAAGLFGLAIIGMAVGVIFSNRCIKGSCGGLASMPGNDGSAGSSMCDACSVPADECRDDAMRRIKQQAENAEQA